MKKIIIPLFAMLLFANGGFTQMGIGTNNPKPSAMLDVTSANKGLLIPRMTSIQRNDVANPAIGLLVYDTDKSTIYMFDGNTWLPFLYGLNDASVPSKIAYNPAGLDLAFSDDFGFSSGLSGINAVVGAPKWDLADNDDNQDYGLVQFFSKATGAWKSTQTLKYTASPARGASFGYSVAVDGDFAVIGAPFDSVGTNLAEGKAFVYKRNPATNNWTLFAELTGNNATTGDNFGFSVSISGNYLAVGAPGDDVSLSGTSYANQGSTYVFFYNGSSWVQQAKLYDADGADASLFGSAVSIDTKGFNSFVAVGAPGKKVGNAANQGSVYIWGKLGTAWPKLTEVTASNGGADDKFGYSVAMNGVTEQFVVGAPYYDGNLANIGFVYLFEFNAGLWPQRLSFGTGGAVADANVGHSIAFGPKYVGIPDYKRTVDGLLKAGVAYFYEATPAQYHLQTSIYDNVPFSNGGLGYSISMWGHDVLLTSLGRGWVLFNNVE